MAEKTASLQQHGRVLSVSRAYADIFDAEVFYQGEIPLVDYNGGRTGFGDQGMLTITPR
jgi:hypothetical protein